MFPAGLQPRFDCSFGGQSTRNCSQTGVSLAAETDFMIMSGCVLMLMELFDRLRGLDKLTEGEIR